MLLIRFNMFARPGIRTWDYFNDLAKPIKNYIYNLHKYYATM